MIVYNNLTSMFLAFMPDFAQPAAIFCTIVLLLLLLLIYKQHFKPEYEGGMTGGDIRKAWLFILLQCGYTILVQSISLFDGNVFHAPTLTISCSALLAGVSEEIIFRGLLLTTLLRCWKNKENRMIAAAVISSAVFSMTHLINLLAGASIVMTVVQIVGALFIGIFYAAVYMRSGNLIPLMIGHFFHDIMQYIISAPDSSETLVLTGNITWMVWVDLALTIVIGSIGLWLLRKDKRQEVTEIWNKKWTLQS